MFVLQAQFLIDTLLQLPDSRLPLLSIKPNAKVCISSKLPNFRVRKLQKIVEVETIKKSQLHFDCVRIEMGQEPSEISDLLDTYMEAIVRISEEIFSNSKSKFMVYLLRACFAHLNTQREDEQWSLDESKWTSQIVGVATAAREQKTDRFVIEYFLSVFERLLESSFGELDDELVLALLDVTKVCFDCYLRRQFPPFCRFYFRML